MARQSGNQLPDYQITQLSNLLGELPTSLQLTSGTIGERAGVEVHLDVASPQVAADELLRERILDITLDGAAQRPGAVRAVLAGDLDNPVDDFRGQRDFQLAIGEVLVELRDEQRHDAPQILVGECLEDD